MAGMRRLTSVTVFALLALTAGACARVHARTIGPPLDAPAPPPRVVPAALPPIESQPIVASPPVGDVTAPPPSDRIPARPAAPRVERPEPAAPPAATPAPPRPATDAPEQPTLQTTANPAAAEQRTRAALANATRDLGRIDVRTLSSDARAQFDIARRFIAQASDALNAKNFEFAQQLADKAATLAALLQKR